jgi:hypothetical protein
MDFYSTINYSEKDGFNLNDIFSSNFFFGFDQPWYNYYWTQYFIERPDRRLHIRSNVDLEYSYEYNYRPDENFTRHFYDGGKELQLPFWHHDLKVCWNNGSRISDLNSSLSCSLTQRHMTYIDYLIQSEDVTIDLYLENNTVKYLLDARFILNSTVLDEISPESFWFPENGSRCFPVLNYHLKGRYPKKELLDVKGQRDYRSQDGFRIYLPGELLGDKDKLLHDPYLNVTITGTIDDPWFDFIIVTIPRENSTIRITTPSRLNITKINSTFDLEDINSTLYENKLRFHGKCLKKGPPHIEWDLINDTDHDEVPDHLDIFPRNPFEWLDDDGDFVGNNGDQFPDDPIEWNDIDGDGIGDNSDRFPENPSEWNDSDDDGYGDNSDRFPQDPLEWYDLDKDGIGDNSDAYPEDPERQIKIEDDEKLDFLWLIPAMIIVVLTFLVLYILIRNRRKKYFKGPR